MTAEQLRNSILQEAISGRLVPQDPNDEPASVLLRHIREEKARLVKEGKLKKKDLAETPIKEEEIPFEIPNNWEWCHIADILQINPKNKAEDSDDAAFIPMEKIKATYLSEFTYSIRKWKEIKNGFTHFANGDIAFAKITPCFQNRKSMILRDLPNGIGAGTTELKVLRPYKGTVNAYYLLFFLESAYFVDQAIYKGTANQQRIISGYLENKLFPLPPLAEQKRIVAKLEELLPIVEQYGKAQKELDELNATLPARLRQSILQQAISGRLVPQNPNDEPASIISTIPEDEIPFEIPSTWKWVMLKDCAAIIGGYAFPSASIKEEKGVRVIRISDISEKGFVNKSVVRYNGHEILDKFKIIPQDILMAMTGGTVGKSLFVEHMDEDMLLNQRVAIIRNNGQFAPYIDIVVKSPHIKSFINDKKNSTNDNISMGDINSFLIPLPPLAEQKRIVAKIEELFAEIDKMSK